MKRAMVFALVLATVACARLPVQRQPDLEVEVPDQWTAGEGVEGAVPHDWWTEFDDPALNALVEEALEHNHDLAAAVARVDAAAAQARIAGADLKPMIDVGVDGSRQQRNFIGFGLGDAPGLPESTRFNSYGLSLNVFWEADLWGRLRARKAAAVADFQASAVDLTAVRLSLAGQVAKVWFALAESQRQFELAEATVDAFSKTAERVRSRYVKGLRPSLDYRLALSDLAAAEANLELRRDARQAVRRQLEVLVGRYPDDTLADNPALPPPPDEVPAGLPATLVSRRPDLVAAEIRLYSADARLLEARRSLYPRLTLTASGGTATGALGDLIDGDFSVWSLAAGIFQPLFQGGRLRAGVDLADANTRAAAESYVQDALRAYGEVETTLASESILVRQEEALAVSSEQASAASELAQDRYDTGLAGIITVLDSQRRALSAESAYLASRRARLENRVDLYLSLGGGFDGTGIEAGKASLKSDDVKDTEESS
jgi:NodT family efflux transporter outer membrane factor (OMF) lipoprotein